MTLARTSSGVTELRSRAVTLLLCRGQAITLLLCCAGIAVCAIAGVSAQSVTFAPVGSIAGPVDLVRVEGRYAYVAAGKTLTLVDISNPAAPTRTGAYTFPEKRGFAPADHLSPSFAEPRDPRSAFVRGHRLNFRLR